MECKKPIVNCLWDRNIDLGEKYLIELNYEQALVQFLNVIEVEPMNSRGYTGAADAYIGLGEIDKAITILIQGQRAINYSHDINRMLSEIEEQQKPPETTPSIKEPWSSVNIELSEDLKVQVEHLIVLSEKEDFESIIDTINMQKFLEFIPLVQEFPLILLNGSHDYGIGIYNGGRCIYFGGYTDMLRNGKGVWLGTGLDGAGIFKVICEWSNDSPNGEGTILDPGYVITGILDDGLWHGAVSFEGIHSGYPSFIAEYNNGYINTIGEPRECGDNNFSKYINWPVGYRNDGYLSVCCQNHAGIFEGSNIVYWAENAWGVGSKQGIPFHHIISFSGWSEW